MIDVPVELLRGYQTFRRDRYPRQAALYGALSEAQAPRVMIVACADSRVDPAVIFTAGPGELFVVRNVANLIPPCQSDATHHGTSAALEFAVTNLDVAHIVVLGHARCGGISACLAAAEQRFVGRFIGPWVGIASAAREAVLSRHPGADPETRRRELELESIRHSVRRLRDYPFVAQAIAGRGMRVHGAWFSIADGELNWLDPENGIFTAVSRHGPAGS